MVASSWLHSFSSSSKSWFTTRYLRKYGYVLSNFLTGSKAGGPVIRELLQEEEDNIGIRSLQDLEDVEKIIGYRFNNSSLLHQAFTHSSYREDCAPYERLEYVGDSVVNLLITIHQFSLYPDLPPGCLTPLRAANVDTEKLARVAVRLNFHKYLRHRRPELGKKIQSFINALPRYPLHSHGLIDAPKVLADIVESTIGAVFVDSNSSIETTWKKVDLVLDLCQEKTAELAEEAFEFSRNFLYMIPHLVMGEKAGSLLHIGVVKFSLEEVTRVLLDPIITPEMLQTNPVKKLFEICQKNKLDVRLVDRWSQEGTYEVFVGNQLRGRGKCCAKKEVALNRAAHYAYKEVVRTLGVK